MLLKSSEMEYPKSLTLMLNVDWYSDTFMMNLDNMKGINLNDQ